MADILRDQKTLGISRLFRLVSEGLGWPDGAEKCVNWKSNGPFVTDLYFCRDNISINLVNRRFRTGLVVAKTLDLVQYLRN